MNGNLVILIGLPRCGKSTYVKRWLTAEHGNFIKSDWNGLSLRVHVSEDELQLALHGCRYSSLSEPIVKNLANIMIRKYLSAGYQVIADDTHTSIDSILSKLKLDPEAEIKFVYPFYQGEITDTQEDDFEYYVNVCRKRALDTKQSDLVPVINRLAPNMWKLMKNPDIIENLREVARDYNKRERVVTV